jgi:putative mRNA 3-end processing factor
MLEAHDRQAGSASAEADDLVRLRPEGLYCPQADVYIDPWRPVPRALMTHAHADHARAGHGHYLCAREATHVMRARLGGVSLQTLDWGESLRIGSACVSFHPAGHVLGSAQIRIEHAGRVWVVTGDYKLEPDYSCRGFEPIACETLVTESTFGLPVYRWQAPERVFREILDWWAACAAEGRPAVIFAYSLGKAQRLIAGLHAEAVPGLPGPMRCHPAIETLNRAYRATGIALPDCPAWQPGAGRKLEAGMLLVTPPATAGSAALERAGEPAFALASGWMQVRGARRRQGIDRGFVLSDHADWPGLNRAIAQSGAERVIVTHGFESVLVRYLSERGLRASSFSTQFGPEREDDAPPDPAHPPQPAPAT